MDWRIKCAAHWLFSLPGMNRLYYPFKRHLARTVFRSPAELRADLAMARGHFRHLRDYLGLDPARALCLEFGAGRDLINNLCLWGLGVERQLAVDLHPLLRPELLNQALRSLSLMEDDCLARRPGGPLPMAGITEALRERFGIAYQAPFDLGRSGLADASLDFILSTNTLEHVPPAEISAILAECRRLLAPGGGLSFRIDYGDHYSYADPAITGYHFLRYSPGAWRFFNPPLHYQNRLRHQDYAALFRAGGFKILRQEAQVPEGASRAILAQPLAAQFLNRPSHELLPVSGWFLLAPEATQPCLNVASQAVLG